MKFSTRARYGMRAMLDLAANEGDELVFLKDIATRQGISKRYLEHMMSLLRNRGLVVAERGASGGYRLARPPEDIRLDEVFEALEGFIDPVDCTRDPAVCDRVEDCAARELWREVAEAIREVLAGYTLGDLEAKQQTSLSRERRPERAAERKGGLENGIS